MSGVTRRTGIPSRSLTSTVCFSGYDLLREVVIEEGPVTVPSACPSGTARSAMHVEDPLDSEPGEPNPFEEDGYLTLAVKWSNHEGDSDARPSG